MQHRETPNEEVSGCVVQRTECSQSRIPFSIVKGRIQNETRDYKQAKREKGKLAEAPIEEEEEVEYRHYPFINFPFMAVIIHS